MQRMQQSTLDAPRDRPTAQPELLQLRARDDPRLTISDRSDQPINMHNCPTPAQPTGIGQYRTADVQK
jgi:hypothetical protein